MNQVTYYAKLVRVPAGKTPKYVISKQAGCYPPMGKLIGRDGRISMNLIQSKDAGSTKDNVPAMRLQAKNSLNFSGIKDLFTNGKLSGFAYGEPNDTDTYRKGKYKNPFFPDYTADGFLFIIHAGNTPIPAVIELMVLSSAKSVIAAYCKQLEMGGFDEILQSLREQATEF